MYTTQVSIKMWLRNTHVIACLLTLLLCCQSDHNQAYEELSSDAFFKRSGRAFSYIKSANHLHRSIFPQVIDYAFNEDFIIAIQIPDKKYISTFLAGELNTGRESFDVLRHRADSLILIDPEILQVLSRKENFWIIVNENHELIGPLSKQEYLDQRRVLNIPDDLDF